ncbi:MAG: mono/diheme cytochrome c family protein [Gammaproteobacteria bacterium]|jgi:mono/diheme cytochrome c family protein
MIIIRFILLTLTAALLFACADQSNENADHKDESKIATSHAQALPAPAARVNGQAIFESNCLPCHAEGPGHPGTMRLALRSGEDKSVLTKRNDLTVDYVKIIVRQGLLEMPPFRPTEITDSELDVLAAYLADNK